MGAFTFVAQPLFVLVALGYIWRVIRDLKSKGLMWATKKCHRSYEPFPSPVGERADAGTPARGEGEALINPDAQLYPRASLNRELAVSRVADYKQPLSQSG